MNREDQTGVRDTVVRVGGSAVTLTRDDVESMRDALLAFLRQSDYYARERLIGWTTGDVHIDRAGLVRVGPWLLGSDGSGLFLRLRERSGSEAGKAHRASVTRRGDAWVVTGVAVERIRPLRRRS